MVTLQLPRWAVWALGILGVLTVMLASDVYSAATSPCGSEPGPEMEWDERGQRPVGPPDPDEVAAYEDCLKDPPSSGDAVALAIADFPGDVLLLGLVIGGFCAASWISERRG